MLKSTHKPIQAQAPLPEGWSEHTAPSGHKYYYNASTKQSTYARPAPPPDPEEDLLIDYNATKPDTQLHNVAQALDEFHRNTNSQQNQFQAAKPGFEGRRRGHGGDRPKSKKAIPGAEPWVLVMTKYGRRFVHNVETGRSLWKFPQQVMMKVIEMDKVEWDAKKEEEKRDGQGEEGGNGQKDDDGQKGRDAVAKANEARRKAELEAERAEESSDYEEVEVTDDEAAEDKEGASKRPRLDPDVPAQPTGPIELNEDDIEWQLAQMEEDAYSDDYLQEEEEGLPMTEEDNVALFRDLLDVAEMSPYTTFEKVIEDNNIVEDDRYTALPNMHRRREVFTEWSRDRIARIQDRKAREQEIRKVNPKLQYLRFLGKNASVKLYWPEFKRKYKKEAVMKDYEISDKERERMYRDLVAKLKLGESDRRKELIALLKSVKSELDRTMKVDDLPESALRDIRFYVLDEKKRDEIVQGFLSTL